MKGKGNKYFLIASISFFVVHVILVLFYIYLLIKARSTPWMPQKGVFRLPVISYLFKCWDHAIFWSYKLFIISFVVISSFCMFSFVKITTKSNTEYKSTLKPTTIPITCFALGLIGSIIMFTDKLDTYFSNYKSFIYYNLYLPLRGDNWFITADRYWFITLFFPLFVSVSLFSFSIVFPTLDIKKGKEYKHLEQSKYKNATVSTEDLFIPLGKFIFRYFFTFGIWQLIWIYKTTKGLDLKVQSNYRSAKRELLLCIFIPFYIIYWTYKTAQIVDEYAKQENIGSDISTICLILSLFVPIVPPIIIQDKINTIVNNKSENQMSKRVENIKENVPNLSTVDELKKYRELLDDGTITQEEFDAVKKQLLNI